MFALILLFLFRKCFKSAWLLSLNLFRLFLYPHSVSTLCPCLNNYGELLQLCIFSFYLIFYVVRFFFVFSNLFCFHLNRGYWLNWPYFSYSPKKLVFIYRLFLREIRPRIYFVKQTLMWLGSAVYKLNDTDISHNIIISDVLMMIHSSKSSSEIVQTFRCVL